MADNTQASQGFSIQWDSTGSPSVGENLFIRMAVTTDSGPSTATQIIFDDLSLTITVMGAQGTLFIVR